MKRFVLPPFLRKLLTLPKTKLGENSLNVAIKHLELL